MRTSIDIDDALLAAAKSYAVRSQKTLEAVVEQALRELLSDSSRQLSDAPPIPVFCGLGVQPGVDLADNAALEDLMSARS
ncbi:MAG: type II toxin-antitoxin system VapB family antitoxin [Bryobacterales bacterium]|nr:type II toxin-antitoxin system VapB family antitoxin [Bryobacterales bacterium]